MIEAVDSSDDHRARLARMRRWNLLTWITWVGYAHLLALASALIYANAGGAGPLALIGFADAPPDRPDAYGVVRLKIQSDRPAPGVGVEVGGDDPGGAIQPGKDYKIRQPMLLLPMDGGKVEAVIDVLENPARKANQHLRVTLKGGKGGRVDPARSSWTVLIPAASRGGQGPQPPEPGPLEVSFARPTMNVAEGARVRAELAIRPGDHPTQTVSWRLGDRSMPDGTIHAGATSDHLVFDLPEDEVYSGDRKVVATLGEGPGVRVGSPSTLEITVRDNDSRPTLRVVREQDGVDEGSGRPLTFRLKLEGAATPGEVSVRCKVVDADLGLSIRDTGPVLALRPGERERLVEIPVVDDHHRNADRKFAVELTGAAGALFEPATQQLHFTVKDDDGLPGRVLLVVVHDTDLELSIQKIKLQLSQLLGVTRFQDAFVGKSVFVVRRDAKATTWNPANPFPDDGGRPFRADEPIEDAINAALEEAKGVEVEAIDRHFAILILWPTRDKPGTIPFNPAKLRKMEGHPTRIFGLGTSVVEFGPLKAKFEQVFEAGTARSYNASDLDFLQDYLAAVVTQFTSNPPKP